MKSDPSPLAVESSNGLFKIKERLWMTRHEERVLEGTVDRDGLAHTRRDDPITVTMKYYDADEINSCGNGDGPAEKVIAAEQLWMKHGSFYTRANAKPNRICHDPLANISRYEILGEKGLLDSATAPARRTIIKNDGIQIEEIIYARNGLFRPPRSDFVGECVFCSPPLAQDVDPARSMNDTLVYVESANYILRVWEIGKDGSSREMYTERRWLEGEIPVDNEMLFMPNGSIPWKRDLGRQQPVCIRIDHAKNTVSQIVFSDPHTPEWMMFRHDPDSGKATIESLHSIYGKIRRPDESKNILAGDDAVVPSVVHDHIVSVLQNFEPNSFPFDDFQCWSWTQPDNPNIKRIISLDFDTGALRQHTEDGDLVMVDIGGGRQLLNIAVGPDSDVNVVNAALQKAGNQFDFAERKRRLLDLNMLHREANALLVKESRFFDSVVFGAYAVSSPMYMTAVFSRLPPVLRTPLDTRPFVTENWRPHLMALWDYVYDVFFRDGYVLDASDPDVFCADSKTETALGIQNITGFNFAEATPSTLNILVSVILPRLYCIIGKLSAFLSLVGWIDLDDAFKLSLTTRVHRNGKLDIESDYLFTYNECISVHDSLEITLPAKNWIAAMSESEPLRLTLTLRDFFLAGFEEVGSHF